MKKILLINTNNEKIPYPVAPLGICLLAETLKNNYNVKIYDGMFNNTKDSLINTLQIFNSDYIGLSIRNIDNLQIDDPVSFIETIKTDYIEVIRKHSDSPIILGGSGFSIYPEYLMKYYDADYGVIGEGENALPELLNCLEKGNNASKIPNVITKKSFNFSTKNLNYNVSNLTNSNIDLNLDFTNYKNTSAYSIQTKRGCAHRCIYCTYPVIEGYNFRPRNPKSIADEIEEAHKRLGYISFEFVDSTFNDPAGHAEEICREIIKKNINIKLRTMGINPVNVTGELFNLMKKAGFTQIDCTPDTASVKMIKNMKKNFTKEELIKSAKTIKEYQMPTIWFFIFGGPGETEETILESFEFIDKYIDQLDMAHITMGLRIYPNTDLYKIALSEGYIKKNNDLINPVFYISKELGYEKLHQIIKRETAKRLNCLTASESKPPEDMLNAAIQYKKRHNTNEPLFRILLKLRYNYFKKQNLINSIIKN